MKNDKEQKLNEKSTKQTKEKQIDEVLGELVPHELAEVMKTAPSGVRKQFIAMLQASGPMLSPFHALLQKFTPEHIDKFLDYSQKDDENNYKLQSSNRFFYFGYMLVVVIFLVFLVVYLARENQALLNDILKILLIFAGGFGSGFGFKAYIEKKE